MTATDPARDARIRELHDGGWSQQRIAVDVGLTQVGVHHALRRLAGQPRHRTPDRKPHPSGNPAHASDPALTVCCVECGRLSWRGQRSPLSYRCQVCRRPG